MTVAGREASAHGRAVRGDHLHSVELRVRRALYLFQHARAEALEHGGSRGAQVLGAGLVAGGGTRRWAQDTPAPPRPPKRGGAGPPAPPPARGHAPPHPSPPPAGSPPPRDTAPRARRDA